jgi:hypothetical protein
MLKAERLEKEAFALLTLEQRAKFDEDEALIRRDRETQNTLRAEVRAAKKRKRDAVEEVKFIRLVEKEAKDKHEAYERSKRRRVEPPVVLDKTAAQDTGLFVTPIGDLILPGDFLHELQTAIAAGKFAIPGTSSNPDTSEILAVLAKHSSPVDQSMPFASTSQEETPTPTASTSQARTPKAAP